MVIDTFPGAIYLGKSLLVSTNSQKSDDSYGYLLFCQIDVFDKLVVEVQFNIMGTQKVKHGCFRSHRTMRVF